MGSCFLCWPQAFKELASGLPSVLTTFPCRKRVQKYSFFSFAQAFRTTFFQKFFFALIDRGLHAGIFPKNTAGTANNTGFSRRIKRILRFFVGELSELGELFYGELGGLSEFLSAN
jgi:hypothetical protein